MGFIEDIAPLVQKHAKEYGILCNSAIIGQAILESSSGESELGKMAHNYFGLKYRPNRIDCASGIYYKIGSEQNKDGSYVSSNMAWFKFNSAENGVLGYLQFINTSNYSNLKGVTDPRRYLELIKQDKYATSLDYVDKVMNVVDKYGLRKYDNVVEDKGVNGMSYTLKVNYADKSNYGGSRSVSKIKYIVIHFTANDGDTDESNAKYFKRKNIKASAHMFVDDDSVTISVPDTVVAWSVGGSRYKNYKSTGGAKYYGKCTNNNSISVEMCDTIKDGKIMASEKTMQNTAELVKDLMVKYNVPIENVIRHFDCTGKSCPAYFVDQNAWNNFKARLGGSAVSTPSQTTSTDLISIGKVHAKNFIGQSNTSKNIDSLTLKQLKSMVLQRAINLDYNKGLTLDADFGIKSKSALGTHYVKLGEKQYMVTCAEILMYLNDKNPNGVELPATFDDRLVKASDKNKITASDFLNYIA